MLGVARPIGAAMRPVEEEPVADRPAEQLIDRDAQGLCLDVDERILDGADRLGIEPAGRLPRCGVEQRRDALHGPRVLTDETLAEPLDNAAEALRAITLHVF